MRKIHLLINEIKDRTIQENFKRILLWINSTLRALTIPSYTSENRPANDLQKGDTIFNETTGSLETWDGTEFSSWSGGGETSLYSGTGKYSARFSAVVTGPTIKDALDQIFLFTAVNPSTSLTLTPSAAREKGNTLVSVLLSTVNGMGTNPVSALASLVFKRGAAVLNTIASPGANETHTESTAVTDTTTFSATLTDADARVATASATITFYYPILYCVGAKAMTRSAIYAAATKILSASRVRNLSFTTTLNVAYYAYPAALGVLTSIIDPMGWDVISDWTLRTENITGLDGTSQAYNIYEFENDTTTTQAYTFN